MKAAQGKRCMAHAQGTQGIKNALRAGVASIEHGIYLDDEAIDLMREKNAYLVPTLIAPIVFLNLHKYILISSHHSWWRNPTQSWMLINKAFAVL